MIKYLVLVITILAFGFTTEINAQDKPEWEELDKSPFDMAYYPAKAAWRNYLKGDDRTMSPRMRITYARPGMKGRKIFGELVPYGKEWRLGANESTQLSVYSAVEINGITLNRGAYTLSATPQADHWLIHISSQTNIWGSDNRDQEQTLTSVKVMTEALTEAAENLSIAFQRVDDESANLVIDWESTRVKMPISMNPTMFEDMDASPMDQVHYPATSAYQNYLKAGELEGSDPKIKVIYSRPQKKGRKIFGELLEYGKVWRIGANESTEITFYSDVTIMGKALKRGTYNLYAVVNESSWDFIFNTDRPAWGPPNRDEEKDVLTVSVPVEMGNEDLEILNLKFMEKSETEVDLLVAWEKHRASLGIKF